MLALTLSVLAVLAPPKAPPIITPEEAAKRVGQHVIVQGRVTQIVLSVNLTTHINFGGIYPNHVFTVTIFKANQSRFPGVREYDGKVIQVEGEVNLYRGKPEIVLTERSQIRIAE